MRGSPRVGSSLVPPRSSKPGRAGPSSKRWPCHHAQGVEKARLSDGLQCQPCHGRALRPLWTSVSSSEQGDLGSPVVLRGDKTWTHQTSSGRLPGPMNSPLDRDYHLCSRKHCIKGRDTVCGRHCLGAEGLFRVRMRATVEGRSTPTSIGVMVARCALTDDNGESSGGLDPAHWVSRVQILEEKQRHLQGDGHDHSPSTGC